MSDELPVSPTAHLRRRPSCTIAAWVVMVVGLLITFGVYQWAVAHRSGGDWLPGIGEALLGIAATAVLCVGTGLAALLRRERRAWAVLPPFLAGLMTILYFTYNILSKR
jgi:hypothetical protein